MSSRGQVSSEERVFSLLLALAATRNGATKSELLNTVHGYSTRYADPAKRQNVERQFERDKDALRDLGIPIETFEPLDEPGNNQATRYRINPEHLRLPDDIEFTTEEVRLLQLASFVWRDTTLASDARLATMKLSALGEHLDTRMLGFAPRISAIDPAFRPLQECIERHHQAEFSYRKAGAQVSEVRKVAPLSLSLVEGRWHLIAWDFNRNDTRVFLLNRIVGAVTKLSAESDPGLFSHVARVQEELLALRDSQVAYLEFAAGSEAQAHLPHEAHYLDEAIFAEEIAAYGPDVYVVSPHSLRERVVSILRSIAKLHADAALDPRKGLA